MGLPVCMFLVHRRIFKDRNQTLEGGRAEDQVVDLGNERGKYKNKTKGGCFCIVCEGCSTQGKNPVKSLGEGAAHSEKWVKEPVLGVSL